MRPITIRGRGHPRVRATHAKTIELTTERELTGRGTCIVGVGVALDPARLGALSGRVVVTFEAGGHRELVRGLANPRYDAATGRLVIRRSRHRADDTLVVGADKGSADLDRALVAALADGGVELRVTVARDADLAGGADDEVLDADLLEAQAVAAKVAALLRTGDAPGAVTFAGALPRRAADRRRTLADAADALRVWQVRPEDLAEVMTEVGARLVAAVTDPATPDEHVHRGTDDLARRRSVTTAFVVVRPPDGGAASVDDRLLRSLADAGVPTKTLHEALAAATGVSKRDAYERVVRARG